MTVYRMLKDGAVWTTSAPPSGAQSILLIGSALLPPLVTEMHRNFRAWGDAALSPGAIEPARVFVTAKGALAFAFSESGPPESQLPQRLAANVGAARDLAGWLLLLDKWMETFVVLARARHVWTPAELASALPFVAPIYQPPSLIEMAPENWERMARALAQSVADGALKGGEEGEGPENRHWQKEALASTETTDSAETPATVKRKRAPRKRKAEQKDETLPDHDADAGQEQQG